MTVQHPHAELSAYIDDALSPADRAALEGHLDVCSVCRTHVAQLRATTVLLRALPDPVPSRRLMPRIAVPVWLAPLRTLMTLASGAAVFLFIASALVSNITFLAGGSAAAPAREASGDAVTNAQPPLTAPQRSLQDASPRAPAPSPGAAFAVTPTAAPSADAKVAQGGATPDDAKRLERATAAPSAPALGYGTDTALASSSQPRPSPLVNPWLWLMVAVLCGAIALVLDRRLRASA